MSLCYIVLNYHSVLYFCNEMILSLICINSQPLSHVINVYYEAQMMILM